MNARRVRELRFRARSTLPLAAACLVANAVRETLGTLLGEAVALSLLEAVRPEPRAWRTIGDGARLYRVRGSQADALIVVRERDATALAGAAFGEPVAHAQLSTLEGVAFERIVRAVAQQLTPLCGPGVANVEPARDCEGCVSYLELQLERPARARIGIALFSEPATEVRGAMQIADLADLRVAVRAGLDAGTHDAGSLAELEPGSLLPLPAGLRGCLTLAGRPLGSGECGVLGRYYAVAVDCMPTGGDEPAR